MTDYGDPRPPQKVWCDANPGTTANSRGELSRLINPSRPQVAEGLRTKEADELLLATEEQRESLVEQFVSEDFDEHRLFDLLSDGDWELKVELLNACSDFEIEIRTPRLVRLLESLLKDSNDFVFLSAAQTLLICTLIPWDPPSLESRRSEALERLRDELS